MTWSPEEQCLRVPKQASDGVWASLKGDAVMFSTFPTSCPIGAVFRPSQRNRTHRPNMAPESDHKVVSQLNEGITETYQLGFGKRKDVTCSNGEVQDREPFGQAMQKRARGVSYELKIERSNLCEQRRRLEAESRRETEKTTSNKCVALVCGICGFARPMYSTRCCQGDNYIVPAKRVAGELNGAEEPWSLEVPGFELWDGQPSEVPTEGAPVRPRGLKGRLALLRDQLANVDTSTQRLSSRVASVVPRSVQPTRRENGDLQYHWSFWVPGWFGDQPLRIMDSLFFTPEMCHQRWMHFYRHGSCSRRRVLVVTPPNTSKTSTLLVQGMVSANTCNDAIKHVAYYAYGRHPRGVSCESWNGGRHRCFICLTPRKTSVLDMACMILKCDIVAKVTLWIKGGKQELQELMRMDGVRLREPKEGDRYRAAHIHLGVYDSWNKNELRWLCRARNSARVKSYSDEDNSIAATVCLDELHDPNPMINVCVNDLCGSSPEHDESVADQHGIEVCAAAGTGENAMLSWAHQNLFEVITMKDGMQEMLRCWDLEAAAHRSKQEHRELPQREAETTGEAALTVDPASPALPEETSDCAYTDGDRRKLRRELCQLESCTSKVVVARGPETITTKDTDKMRVEKTIRNRKWWRKELPSLKYHAVAVATIAELRLLRTAICVMHAEEGDIEGSVSTKVQWSMERIGWVLIGGEYNDVAWKEKDKLLFYYAIITLRGMRSWNPVKLQIMLSVGVAFGPDDMGAVKKQYLDFKQSRQLGERIRHVGVHSPLGHQVLPAVQRCAIVDIRTLI